MDPTYRVDQWQTVDTQLFWAYRGNVAREFRHSKEPSYHYGLWHLYQGRTEIDYGGGRLKAKKGDFVFLPPSKRTQDFTNNTELLSIRFLLNGPDGAPLLDCEHPMRLKGDTGALSHRGEELATRVLEGFGPYRFNLYRAKGRPAAHFELNSAFTRFLAALIQQLEDMGIGFNRLGDMDNRVVTCINRVKQSPMDKRWTEIDMAKVAGVSPVHLNRPFQESVGITAHTWLDEYKLTHARLVLMTDVQIKEAAYSLGFSSPQHFSTWFKRKTGQTPKEFRQTREEA